jgi:head-tail adaptor
MTLTSAEIDAMRAAADALLASTCTIQRASESRTAQGGVRQTWADLATGVPCRLDVLRGLQIRASNEEEVNGALGVVLDYMLYVKHDQDIAEKDRVVLGGHTFEVQAVLGDESWLFEKRAKLTRIV